MAAAIQAVAVKLGVDLGAQSAADLGGRLSCDGRGYSPFRILFLLMLFGLFFFLMNIGPRSYWGGGGWGGGGGWAAEVDGAVAAGLVVAGAGVVAAARRAVAVPPRAGEGKSCE